MIEQQPDLTLDEVVAAMRAVDISGSRSALSQFYTRHRISFKKACAQRAKTAACRQGATALETRQGLLNSARLVFIDETGTHTAMTRLRGRCRTGVRLIAHVPHAHWKTTTLVARLRCEAITAPLVVDGAMNGEIFRAYVEQHLAPTLRPGDLVIMDNRPAHKLDGIRQMIEAAAARLVYLPPYSPDLNPIEQAFAKRKALLRAAAKRTIPALGDSIAAFLMAFSRHECANFFRHAPPCRICFNMSGICSKTP